MNVPFNRTYWVLTGKLMAGCFPGSPDPNEKTQKLKGLLNCGIRTVVNLMEADELDHSGNTFAEYEGPLLGLAGDMGVNISIKRFPVKDMWIPSRLEMCRILDYIDTAITAGKPVYVHCWGGRGRTGTVVGCYLARHGYASDCQILDRICELRGNVEDAHLASPETNQQIDMVLSWVAGE